MSSPDGAPTNSGLGLVSCLASPFWAIASLVGERHTFDKARQSGRSRDTDRDEVRSASDTIGAAVGATAQHGEEKSAKRELIDTGTDKRFWRRGRQLYLTGSAGPGRHRRILRRSAGPVHRRTLMNVNDSRDSALQHARPQSCGSLTLVHAQTIERDSVFGSGFRSRRRCGTQGRLTHAPAPDAGPRAICGFTGGVQGRESDVSRSEARSGLATAEAGWPLHNAAQMLGHANIAQTSTYLNATRVGLQDAMRRLDAVRCNPVARTADTGRPPLRNGEDATTAQGLVD
jgi:hypothetical protein